MKKILYQDKKYQVKFDNHKGYCHLYPVPTKKEVDQYYAQEFYNSNYAKQINDSSKKVVKQDEQFFDLQHRDMVEIIARQAPGKTILDIGCGYGGFLKYAKKQGYKVTGFDPVPQAVDYVKSKGINAWQADIEDFSQYNKQKFGTATLIHVLEHLRAPGKVLESINQNILKPKGLLIVKVPNEFNQLQTIADKKYKLKQWWVSAPQHINYFTPEHLENLIAKAGFKVILKEATFPLEFFLLQGDQYVGHPKIGKAIHNKRVLFEKTLSQYDNNFKRQIYQKFADLGIGREIIIYAIKK